MTLLQTGAEGFQVSPSVLVNAAVVLVVAYLFGRFLTSVLSELAERSPRRRITIKLFIPITKFLVYGAATYLVFGPLLRLSSAQLLAVSGLLGAALGFGLRDLFAGVVGGLLLVTERPYQVGDKVEIDGDYGEVTGIGLWATTLTTPDDTVVRVTNASLFTSNVANANDGNPEMMVVVDVAVAPGADIDRATGIVEDALVTSRYVYVDDDHPVVVLVEDETYYRTIRGKAYVADLRDEFAFASDVTERTLAAFEAQGIETPTFPGVGVVDDGDG
ncbi:Small-conductance mechanosensitive channel [Halogeometricum rufum]|uniref:Small-conductance mechanosensitive channel n=1 Tax=Halogeometricum rufum TaxID=553469 RepID=A0A1I6FZ25_9EURY|nr:mechanosensitive ion channel domain-containing protein [Halogeometricum rufum]SFR35203.1 Small-conductance mechanosensitive channel [Halogeometricum rufum]